MPATDRIDVTTWLLEFEEYDVDNCLVCKAEMSPLPDYLGHMEGNRWVAHFEPIYPFCHALCLQEALLRKMQPCEECRGTGVYRFQYRVFDDYETESIDCPVCPNSQGYFIEDDTFRTMADAVAEQREADLEAMYTDDDTVYRPAPPDHWDTPNAAE